MIRRVGPADIPAMRALNGVFAEAFDDAASYAPAPDDDYLRRVLGQPQVIVLVAEAEGRVVGGLVAYALHKLEQARSEVYLYDLAVAAGHRRRGIATALIGRLCAIARVQGAWTVFVQADRGDDAAIALYSRLGRREDVLHFDILTSPDEGGPGE